MKFNLQNGLQLCEKKEKHEMSLTTELYWYTSPLSGQELNQLTVSF